MDLSKTGKLIFSLRKESGLTQKQLADILGICPKTVSKWETGHGFPDVGFITELSRIFKVDARSLLDGELPKVKKDAGNVKRTKFYVCEQCGNLLTSTGNAQIICCGRTIIPLEVKKPDSEHKINVKTVENDFYITFSHPMNKEHYISFASSIHFDRFLTVKLYPEQAGEIRFPVMYGAKLYLYCNIHGLFVYDLLVC